MKEADHSFHVLVRSGRNDREVLDEVLDALAAWIDEIAGRAPARMIALRSIRATMRP